MSRFEIYLEIDDAGRCMIHVADLPGCVVTAVTQDAALVKLPEGISAYYQWLGRHGEDVVAPSEPITWNIVAIRSGVGPFDPGDAAAMFDWEQEPITRQEMERAFQLAAYSRADLLSLVRPLSRSVRKWQADPDSMSINRVLRHIGNAEQWYVSRLVDPLPADWADHAGLSLFKFLKTSRETAVECLRQLSDEALSQVYYPAHRTHNPSEPWTARKVMRRFLEHEREHLDHIRQILDLWRRHLLARIAADRAYLLWQLRNLDEETLSRRPVAGGWTPKDLLTHVAGWDAVQTGRMSLVNEGRLAEIQPVGDAAAMDARNMELYHQYKELSLEQALAVCLKERGGYLAMLGRLSDETIHRQIRMPWGWRTRMRVWAKWRYQHDTAHAKELAQWREQLPREVLRSEGPGYLLRTILQAARKEFLSLAALIPDWERDTRPVCGVWTLKDLVGHLTDWELVGVDALRQLVDGHTPEFESTITDFDAFNNNNAAARRDQPWELVWGEFNTTRQTLLDLLAQLAPQDLSRTFVAPWGSTISAYNWTKIWPGHEREHAVDLRLSLQMLRLPKRLRQAH